MSAIRVIPGLIGLFLATSITATSVTAQRLDLKVERSMDQLVAKGFDYLYNLNYDEAEGVFSEIIRVYPDDPAGYCYLSSNVWLRYLNDRKELEIGNFTSAAYFGRKEKRPLSEDIRKRFHDIVETAVAKAEAVLATAPDNVRALYYLGTAYGNLAAFQATAERSLWSAFRNGSKAHELHEKVLKLDPEFFDAYLTVGLYDYVAGSIPWSVRWLATIVGFRGNRERGLETLQIAAEKARYNRKDARVIAVVLFTREKRYEEALTYLEPLQREFTSNPLLHADLVRLQLLAGRYGDAQQRCREFLARIDEGRPNYDRIRPEQIRVQLGRAYMADSKLKEARETYAQIVEDTKPGTEELTWAHLRLGQVADLLEERSAARSHYEKVLTLPEFGDSRDQAKKYLKTPYRL